MTAGPKTPQKPGDPTKAPPGYKNTEVGVIPEDWKVLPVGELTVKVGSGITPTGGSRVYKQVGRAFLRSQNVGWGSLLMEEIAYIDEQTHESFKETEVESGDVLLNITGASIGRSAVADRRVEGGNVNQHVCIIRPKKGQLDPYFLKDFLLSGFGQRQIDSFQAGGNREGLNFLQIRSFLLPLPPLHEQRAIAAALSDVDALISALDALISKKRAVKTAAMQQLLTGKRRLPGFSGEWQTRRLGDVFTFLGTANNPRSDLTEDGEVAYIHYGDIHGTSSSFLDCGSTKIPRISRELVERVPLLEDGDLVMADASEDYDGVGKSVEVKNTLGKKVVAGLHTLLLRGNKSIAADGFKGYLQYVPELRAALMKLATGISVYGISKNNVKNVEIKLPSIEEQTAIAEVLSDMDAEISALEARREKTWKVKRGVMQELLTGRTRLV